MPRFSEPRSHHDPGELQQHLMSDVTHREHRFTMHKQQAPRCAQTFRQGGHDHATPTVPFAWRQAPCSWATLHACFQWFDVPDWCRPWEDLGANGDKESMSTMKQTFTCNEMHAAFRWAGACCTHTVHCLSWYLQGTAHQLRQWGRPFLWWLMYASSFMHINTAPTCWQPLHVEHAAGPTRENSSVAAATRFRSCLWLACNALAWRAAVRCCCCCTRTACWYRCCSSLKERFCWWTICSVEDSLATVAWCICWCSVYWSWSCLTEVSSFVYGLESGFFWNECL